MKKKFGVNLELDTKIIEEMKQCDEVFNAALRQFL
jgi:hypothetical protein